MPDLTPRLKLPKPLGNEVHNRAAHNDLVDAIEANAASKAEVAALENQKAEANHSHTASHIGYSGSTNLQARDVEAALDELDVEKAPVNHAHGWAEITGKPTTFPPAAHSHGWTEITGKPTVFPPSGHGHGGSEITGQVPDSAKLGGVAASEFERSVNAQAKADLATEEGLVIEAALPVEGAEPEQVATTKGPAIQFAKGATQSVQFCRRWPFASKTLYMELLIAASAAHSGAFRLQVGWQVNGGTVTNAAVSVAPGSNTNLYTANLGQVIPAASLPAGAMVTITLSRLSADAADTHTGAMQVHHVRLKRG